MYCPACGTEYREWFTTCSDCGVALLAGTPAGVPNMPLVTVLETSNEFAFGLAKSLLEDADIDYFAEDPHVNAHPVSSVFFVPFTHPVCRVMVAAKDEAAALSALEPVFHPPDVSE